MINNRLLWSTLLAATLGLGVAACDNKGPVEQAGEEVDEAIDTMKHGGEESTSNKVDDASMRRAKAPKMPPTS